MFLGKVVGEGVSVRVVVDAVCAGVAAGRNRLAILRNSPIRKGRNVVVGVGDVVVARAACWVPWIDD